MSIALTIVAGLFAAFALVGAIAGLTPLYVRAGLRTPPAPKTRRDIALEMLGWLAVIALHCYRYPQHLWWFIAVGGCMLGLVAAHWYSTPPAGRPRTQPFAPADG